MQSKYTRPSVTILNAATTAPVLPLVWGYVDTTWNVQDRIPEQFELQLWGTATDNVTLATLYNGVLHPLTFSTSAALSVSGSTWTLAAHGYQTGDGPLKLSTSGTFPSGTNGTTDYWVVWLSSSTFQLATSIQNAMAPTPIVVTTSSGGTGTITLAGDAANTVTPPSRVYWHQKALLGFNTTTTTPGSISITATNGWSGRFYHDATTIAYAISATLSAGNLSALAYPVSIVG